MNERLNLQDLIDLLAQKQEITKKDAETFLRELIALISETIESDDSVKIKDFGTFKLVKVNARKSVDVNTGDAIEIPAHYKVTFSPDRALKDAINRPFAHFESIVLEEGVSFEDVPKEEDDAEETDIADVAIEEEAIEHPVIPALEQVMPEPIEEDLPQELSEEDTTNPETEDIDIVAEQYEEELPITPSPTEASTISDREEDTDNIPAHPAFKAESVSTEYAESDYDRRIRKPHSRRRVYLGLMALLIVVVLAIGGYFFHDIAGYIKGVTHTGGSNNIVIDYSAMPSATVNDTITSKDSVSILKGGTLQLTASSKQAATPAPTADIAKPLGTATIESGQTLRLIALKHYGHKSFWVYIYQENKAIIKNPNNVPLGTKLVLPAPAKYGIDANNQSSVDKAKKAESKLVTDLGL